MNPEISRFVSDPIFRQRALESLDKATAVLRRDGQVSQMRELAVTNKAFRARDFYDPDRHDHRSTLLAQIETDKRNDETDLPSIFDFFGE